MNTILLDEMTWPEVRDALKNGFRTVVFAISATEQHGLHMPLATDALLGDWLARTVAARLGNSLVAPTIRVGCSSHHMSFPGTISLEEATLVATIRGYCLSLVRHGFERFVLIPSHGGNFHIVSETVTQLRAAHPERQWIASADLYALFDLTHRRSREFSISKEESGLHAGEFETSLGLFLFPELIRRESIEPGAMGNEADLATRVMKEGVNAVSASGALGDGRRATAERGEAYANLWVDWILRQLT